MRYLVLGCGAIGGTVAAGLVRDGHDVLVCDADPAVVEAVNADGLRIEGPVEQFTARPAAIGPDDLPARIDFPVLVACKQHHTPAVAALLAGGWPVRRSSPRCRTACPRPSWPRRRDRAEWSRRASTSVPT